MSLAVFVQRDAWRVLPFAALTAAAQDAKPIEWVIGHPAGGGPDIVARTVADAMAPALEALPGTPAPMTAYGLAKRERWGRLAKANNIKVE